MVPVRLTCQTTEWITVRRTLDCGPSEACAKKRSVLLALDAELSAAAAGGPRERHIGAAQPGAQPGVDLSSVTMDQRMADLVRV